MAPIAPPKVPDQPLAVPDEQLVDEQPVDEQPVDAAPAQALSAASTIRGILEAVTRLANLTAPEGVPSAWLMTEWELETISGAAARWADRQPAVAAMLERGDLVVVGAVLIGFMARTAIELSKDKKARQRAAEEESDA